MYVHQVDLRLSYRSLWQPMVNELWRVWGSDWWTLLLLGPKIGCLSASFLRNMSHWHQGQETFVIAWNLLSGDLFCGVMERYAGASEVWSGTCKSCFGICRVTSVDGGTKSCIASHHQDNSSSAVLSQNCIGLGCLAKESLEKADHESPQMRLKTVFCFMPCPYVHYSFDRWPITTG